MNKEQWETIKYFNPSEFNCPEKMDYDFLVRLNLARTLSDVKYIITSDYRDDYMSSHGKGLAVDIRCRDSKMRFKMVRGLIWAGFRRIGVYDLHIHADVDDSRPDGVMWMGKSR